jgi:hypothetical protein
MGIDINIAAATETNTLAPYGTGVDMTPAAYAKALRVNTLTWKSVDLLTGYGITDVNGNGYIDLDDVAGATITATSGLAANGSETGTFLMNVTLDPTNLYGNDPQGDAVTVTGTFILNQ